jgi:hypothetical protein
LVAGQVDGVFAKFFMITPLLVVDSGARKTHKDTDNFLSR